MSFILDALKKLDHKRHKGSVPDLMTVHDPAPQEPKSRSVWPYIFMAALLLNTVVLLALLNPWKSEEPVIAQATMAAQPEPASMVRPGQQDIPADRTEGSAEIRTDNKTLARNALTPDMPLSEASDDAEEAVSKQISPTDEIIASLIITPPKKQDAPIIDDLPVEPAPSDIIESETEKGLPYLDELPLSVQHDIPDMSITAHIYSNDPASRMVSINGSILRQGESVASGLVLEEITPTGIVLDHMGKRFRVRGF
ncbi:MAG TPA: hypothetical protein ENH31_00275 [Nitrospirae bacterium]|nr:hypothetical protein BMS3Abin10_00146 [bacterium BMS3Abin10]GBE39331.1 hypothetical protein BMS3Bbin08_01953 [bacterium BMS3Bbin08]HDK16933.1 hypothetical protein [Nitrospirota bacterium]HDK80987.1 hypothetical protein [Nitrospirota bacterium]